MSYCSGYNQNVQRSFGACCSSSASSDPEDVPVPRSVAAMTRYRLAEVEPVAIFPRRVLLRAVPNPKAQSSASTTDGYTMETLEAAETAGSQAGTRPKRSRTGCLTCRTRRRKCDEGKPICQNCISKGLECQYGAAFKILGKNNYTPEVESNATYGNVRFVGNDREKQVKRTEVCANTGIENGSQSSPINLVDKVVTSSSISSVSQPQEEEMRNCESRTPSQSDHTFALHGLLALNSSKGRSAGLTFSSVDEPHEEPTSVVLDDIAGVHQPLDPNSGGLNIVERNEDEEWQPPHPDQDVLGVCDSLATAESTFDPIFGSDSNSAQNKSARTSTSLSQTYASNPFTDSWVTTHNVASQGSAIELLKHYRYHIAPWLDICDPNQYFGVDVLGMSTESMAVRDVLLELASASLGRSEPVHHQRIAYFSRHTVITLDAEKNVLLNLFYVLIEVVSDLSKFWLHEEYVERAKQVLETVLPQLSSGSALVSSAYWLLVRLLLSCALMATKPIRISLPFIAENLFRAADNDNIARCAQDAMALCVDAVMLSQGDEDRWLQKRYGLNRVEVWKMLIQGFAHWFMHRAQEFQPIIELYPKDGVQSDNDFPVIVFTGSAATLANQLYHTGMLLLLQNKPRFADKPSNNHFSMSTLWHAHRICGITSQNDGTDSWDPCLIASLMVAARTATHRSQHTAIFHTLETVQRLTGFNISQHVDELRSEWQSADGW